MESGFDCENEMTIFSMAKEGSLLSLSRSLGFVKADCLRGYVNLKRVVRGLGVSDFVGVYYALRFGDPNRQRFDIGDSFVKGAVGFRITHSLIEQINKVVKQGV